MNRASCSSSMNSAHLGNKLVADYCHTVVSRDDRGELFSVGLAAIIIDRHLIIVGFGEECADGSLAFERAPDGGGTGRAAHPLDAQRQAALGRCRNRWRLWQAERLAS